MKNPMDTHWPGCAASRCDGPCRCQDIDERVNRLTQWLRADCEKETGCSPSEEMTWLIGVLARRFAGGSLAKPEESP